MTDEIITELWDIKEKIASDHNYDLNSLVAHLRATGPLAGHRVVNLRSLKMGAEQETPANPPTRPATADS